MQEHNVIDNYARFTFAEVLHRDDILAEDPMALAMMQAGNEQARFEDTIDLAWHKVVQATRLPALARMLELRDRSSTMSLAAQVTYFIHSEWAH